MRIRTPRGPYSDPSALPTHRPSTPQTSRGDFSMPETTETFLACHEWDTPLGARGKGRDLLTSGSSFSRQARLGQGINPPPKLHGRREPGAPRTHSQRALGARGPDEEPNRQPDPQAQRSARVSTRPPLHRRALPTTAQPEEEPGRNGGTRSYKKPSATVELGVRPSKHSGSDPAPGSSLVSSLARTAIDGRDYGTGAGGLFHPLERRKPGPNGK